MLHMKNITWHTFYGSENESIDSVCSLNSKLLLVIMTLICGELIIANFSFKFDIFLLSFYTVN